MDPHPDLRSAGIINTYAISEGLKASKAGMTTKEINDVVFNNIMKGGGKPLFYGYHGFPESCCICINDQVVHGVPGDRVLQEDDLITIDCGTEYKGFCVDSADTIIVPKNPTYISMDGSDGPLVHRIPKKQNNLMVVGQLILQVLCNVVKNGVSLYEIAQKGDELASRYSVNIFPQFGGHGIGKSPHEPPVIFHTTRGVDSGYIEMMKNTYLTEGQVICIEPSISLGSTDTYVEDDNWTQTTVDGSLTCHFERTIFVKKDGYEIIC